MTFPLEALAVGALIAGLVGVPVALGGGNTIERFLEPSFAAEQAAERGELGVSGPGRGRAVSARLGGEVPSERRGLNPGSPTRGLGALGRNGLAAETAGSAAGAADTARRAGTEAGAEDAPSVPRSVEIGLMLLSALIAAAGIGFAYKVYVINPEMSDELADRFAGARQILLNKYYVDEAYDATIVAGTMGSARGLWAVDRNVVDGAVNGTGWAAIVGSWFSGLTDRAVVDGLVNLIGRTVDESSHLFRRLQTGLVQNYALLILLGVFAFVTVYLFAR